MADGSVTIDTKLDTSEVEIGEKKIKDSLKRMAVSIDGLGEKAKSSIQKQISSLSKASDQIDKQVSKVNDLKNKLQGLSDQKIETSEYKNISKEIDSIYEKAAKLEAALNEWNSLGVPENSATFKRTEEELQEMLDDMDKLYAKQEEMKTAGTAYVDPKSLSEYQDTAEKLNLEEEKLDGMNNRLSISFAETEQYIKQCAEESQQASSGFSNIGKSIEKFSQKLMTLGISGFKNKIKDIGKCVNSLLKKFLKLTSGAIISGLKRVSSGVLAIHKSANKSTLSLKKLLKYAFGIRTLFALFNKIRSGITDGLQNLANYNLYTKTGEVNDSLSALTSTLTRLKNSLATAFAPILTTVAPILVRFINLVSEAVTRVGMLIAALTGQKTFTKAIGVQESYADSLDNTADSAKEATKAIQGYLSPIDELNKYEVGDTGIDTTSGGGNTGTSADKMFEEVPITNSIKGIADKIKKLIKSEDWEGLGKYIASGINKGLKKIYDAISWDNVGPKVTKFINAFTRTFNSLVDNIDWDLLGRTIGAGINTLVNTLNLLITGIDWYNLGKKFAEGVTGIVKEVDWNNLGQLIGNKFMISWEIFRGFIHNLPYADIGRAVADALNGTFSTISFSKIGDTLATGLNGAFTILYNFAANFNWKQMVDNIAGGINTFVAEFDWKGNGQKLEAFLDNLCSSLVYFAETTDWEAIGKGIGTFIAQIDWWKHLKQVVYAIKTAIDGLFDGLEESGTAGKIIAFLGRAFIAVKVAQITGISSLVNALVGFIGQKLVGSTAVQTLSGSLTTLLGRAASAAAGGFTSLATAIAPLVGTAGLIVAVGAAAVVATSKLASFVETMQGGNGACTTFGSTMDGFIQTLQNRGDIISGSATEIWQLKESLEQEGMTAEEQASATQKIIDKLGEMGVTSEQAEQAFSSLYQQGLIADDMFKILSSSIKTLGDTTTNTTASLDLSKQSIDDLYNNVLPQLQTQLGLSADQVTSLSTALIETESSGGTAQEAFNNVMARAEEMGLNTESVAKIFAEVFPNAVQATKTAVDTNIVGVQEQISSSMATAKADVEEATTSMAADTVESTANMKSDTNDSFQEITSTSETEWDESYAAVSESLEGMKKDTKEAMGRIMTWIQSYWKSVVIDTNSTWELMSKKVRTELSNMANDANTYGQQMANNLTRAISGAVNTIVNSMNNIITRVNGAVNNINNSISGIERGFTFSYNVQLPNGGRRWGNYSLSLPRVSSVPYLASGAVIPPKSEFLAVLGDQKNGNNLEAPESLLRQIVREESGSNNGSNGNTYNVTVNASGRKLLDIIIDEAEMRRNRNGKNPFELA